MLARLSCPSPPLPARSFTLSRHQLQRSISYLGPHARLRRVLARMLSGSGSKNSSSKNSSGKNSSSSSSVDRPVKINVLGGSISFGHGASRPGETDWFSLLRAWLPRAFPKARLEFHNGCVPATPAAFMTLCLEHYLDPDADLVFLEASASAAHRGWKGACSTCEWALLFERTHDSSGHATAPQPPTPTTQTANEQYVLNDGIEDRVAHNRRVRIYERLVRRVLAQRGAPAVVLVQVCAVLVCYAVCCCVFVCVHREALGGLPTLRRDSGAQ